MLITTKWFCPLLIEKHVVFPVSSFPEDGTRTVTTVYTHTHPETREGPQPRSGSHTDLTSPIWQASQKALMETVSIPMVTKPYIFLKWHNHYLQVRVCLPSDILVYSRIIITTTLGIINKKNWKKIQCILQALQNLMYLALFHCQEKNRWHWANWMSRGWK